ncbi:hypothetical protein OOK60_17875 [Trichothermofontia sichuanensis B231]|uniref:hypothetical protein n=1 Tax=Trichothermofontia sichuanensis TaxID=3045816 RepID=UPI0022479B90|nr:hypothetical protein [Trichothermofontia sichuanensis]UZQ54320.1 hypothetical protein OOK60_17875 [Trichothermofontia sichuanensis B231]
MFFAPTNLSLSDRCFLDRLQQLDLQPIADSLKKPITPVTSTVELPIQSMLVAYLQFLFLMYRYPRLSLVPPSVIAAIWQAHILDTRKYQQDCQQLFGSLDLAHHQACPLPLSTTEQQQLINYFATTCALFETHFGTNIQLFDQPGTCLRPGYGGP